MQNGEVVPPKTDSGNRNVPIIDVLYPYLKDIDFSKHERLFPIKEHAILEHFHNALKASGLNDMGFYIAHTPTHLYNEMCRKQY